MRRTLSDLLAMLSGDPVALDFQSFFLVEPLKYCLFILFAFSFCRQGDLSSGECLAISSNFAPTARLLLIRYAQIKPHRLKICAGSSGKLFAQIMAGAPYLAFLSADSERPLLLEKAGRAVPGSRFNYALGRLAFYSRDRQFFRGATIVKFPAIKSLALASPELAPYGRASLETLTALGLEKKPDLQLVIAENAGQAIHFASSGSVQLALASRAQVQSVPGSMLLVPAELHGPIRQEAVLLKEHEAARGFLKYLRRAEAKTLMEQAGYEIP